MTQLYYVRTNGYDMLVAQESGGFVWFTADLEYLPVELPVYPDGETALNYLRQIEVGSWYSWECEYSDGSEVTLESLLDGNEVVAELEVE